MQTVSFPSDYQQVMPYLILDNAMQFLEFTKTVFDAEEKIKHVNEDGSVGHCEIFIGKSVIMFSNSRPEWGAMNAGLFIYVADADTTYQKALDNGAVSVMPPADQEYGRSCGVKDPQGNTWWITSEKK